MAAAGSLLAAFVAAIQMPSGELSNRMPACQRKTSPVSTCYVFLIGLLLLIGTLKASASPPSIVGTERYIATLHSGIASQTLRVSPDGERIAYMAKLDDGGEAVFVNDEQSPIYGGIVNDSLSFSPDSKRVAWGALRDGKKIVVVDGREYSAHNGSAEGMPVWRANSKRFAFFAATDHGKILAVVDGKADLPWDTVVKESFVFSPDGSRYAYVAKDGDSGRVVVDGKPQPPADNIAGFSFSPNGQHFAYVAVSKRSMEIVVDGRELVTARAFLKDSLRFDGSNRVHAVKFDGPSLIRVQLDVSTSKSD